MQSGSKPLAGTNRNLTVVVRRVKCGFQQKVALSHLKKKIGRGKPAMSVSPNGDEGYL